MSKKCVCSSCKQEKLLVLSSLVLGNLCSDCYNDLYFDTREVFQKLPEYHLILADTLNKLHKKYGLKYSKYDFLCNILTIEYDVIYRNKPSKLYVKVQKPNDNLFMYYLIESEGKNMFQKFIKE